MDPQPKEVLILDTTKMIFSAESLLGLQELWRWGQLVTVNNDVDPGPSFCRQVEKIVPLNRYQFSLKQWITYSRLSRTLPTQ